MRKLGLLMGMLLLVSLSAVAQKVEVFGGYSFVNFEPGTALRRLSSTAG